MSVLACVCYQHSMYVLTCVCYQHIMHVLTCLCYQHTMYVLACVCYQHIMCVRKFVCSRHVLAHQNHIQKQKKTTPKALFLSVWRSTMALHVHTQNMTYSVYVKIGSEIQYDT